MQIQTTTTTTETVAAGGQNFRVTTFEQIISVFCDVCPNQESGTKKELEAKGWDLCGGSEFCAEHSF